MSLAALAPPHLGLPMITLLPMQADLWRGHSSRVACAERLRVTFRTARSMRPLNLQIRWERSRWGCAWRDIEMHFRLFYGHEPIAKPLLQRVSQPPPFWCSDRSRQQWRLSCRNPGTDRCRLSVERQGCQPGKYRSTPSSCAWAVAPDSLLLTLLVRACRSGR